MPFVVSAEFLMHTYQGADDTGKSECYPSPERLYKSLVSAAYRVFGFHSEHGQWESHVSDSQLEAVFHWLEANPPDWIRLPRHMRDNRQPSVIVYRNRGSYDRKKTKSVNAMPSVAYGDTGDDLLLWQWEREPAPEIADLISRLCWEIPYLGEACTPVRVTATVASENDFPIDSEHALQNGNEDLSADKMSSMMEFSVPWKGHLRELQKGHATVYPKKSSAIRGDGGEEEKKVLKNDLNSCVRKIGYIRPGTRPKQESLHPWTLGFFIPARVIAQQEDPDACSPRRYEEWEPNESTLVAWSVAMHRMLICQWGYGASPMLTGKYQNVNDVKRPANNVAIQILTSDMPVNPKLHLDLPGFLLMLPQDMPAEDIGMLSSVCERLTGQKLFYSKRFQTLELGDVDTTIDLVTLWQPVGKGYTRLWSPYPLCMRETRRIPDPVGSRRWGAKESVALAVAHTWRNYFSQLDDDKEKEELDRESRYWQQADQVLEDDGFVRIYGADMVTRAHMGDYVHKTQPGNLLVGLTAMLSFDVQSGLDRSAMAIGQSRHLGGGLLIPVDVSKQLLDDTGKPKWIR